MPLAAAAVAGTVTFMAPAAPVPPDQSGPGSSAPTAAGTGARRSVGADQVLAVAARGEVSSAAHPAGGRRGGPVGAATAPAVPDAVTKVAGAAPHVPGVTDSDLADALPAGV